jgi:hypothetical protein
MTLRERSLRRKSLTNINSPARKSLLACAVISVEIPSICKNKSYEKNINCRAINKEGASFVN